MATPNEVDEPEPQVSLCVDCTRHPSLKRIVQEDSVTGLCGLCGRTDATVRNPATVEPMVMLLRALIRYYWDEFEYNDNWGGEPILKLLSDPDNPVVAPRKTDEHYDEFDGLLQEPAYPAVDKGVAIYGGHFDGSPNLLRSLSRTVPEGFGSLQRRLLTENFFEVEPDLTTMLEAFLPDIEVTLPPGEVWLRARVGQKAIYHRYEGGWQSQILRQPWTGIDIGAPPPPKAGNGRLNRTGVAMLYLASDPETAVAEIRPHPGHHVSVGAFESVEALRLADFNPDIALFLSSDNRLDLFATIQAFDRLMSTPVTPEFQTPYLLTQLLAEVLVRRGFDGVQFRSSVSSGTNLCVFRPAKFKFVETGSEVRRVKSVTYETPSVPSLIEPGPDDLLRPDLG